MADDSSETTAEHSKHSPMGAGLRNLGNTCFLNAVLQCLTHTVPLLQNLRTYDHKTPCESREFCLICALRDHIEISLSSSGGIASPLHLVENLHHLSSSFQRFEQEDAHEFMHCFLDYLHNCCLDPKSQDPCTSLQDESFVNQIFGGRLRSQLRCCNCGHCSDTFEPLIDLSLEIENVDTLESALKSFTMVEKIEDPEVQFTCDNCKVEVSVEKQLTLDQAPAVASFHLKRFKSDCSSIEKIGKFVEYPLMLDMHSFLSCPNTGNFKYELYAIVVHTGFSSTSGHYFCFIRSSPDSWHKLDDAQVTRVSKATALSQEAYILFYIRQGSLWFSSLMETQKKCEDHNSATTSPKSVLDDTETRELPFSVRVSKCSSSGSEVDETTDDMDLSPPKTPAGISKQDAFSGETSEGYYEIPRAPSSSVTWQPTSVKTAATAEDRRREEVVKRLVKGMPSSRRSSLLACISPSQGSRSEGSLGIKKRRTSLSASSRSVSPPYSHNGGGVSYQSLSPRSLRLAAEKEDSHLVFQIDFV